jgi:hypothetical protein
MKVQKTFLSPFLGVVFAAVAVTGILMFFEVRMGPITVVHEWLGMAFAIAGIVHLVVNFRQLTSYFKTRHSWIALALGIALIVIFVIAGSHHGEHGPRHGQPPQQQADDD